MENRNVGWLIMGIALIIVGIIFLLNSAMKEIVDAGCPLDHGVDFCPAYDTINKQTYLALSIVGVLLLLGIVFIFSKTNTKVVVKRIEEKRRKKIHSGELNMEEKKVIAILESEGPVFQSDLIDKTGFGKAKVTRILDKLENRGYVERKRRGMSNIVLLSK